MAKAKFFIEGMTCSACSSGIERSLLRKDSITEAKINLISKVASIKYDKTKISLNEIFALIKKLGYTPTLHENDDVRNTPIATLLKTRQFGALDKRLFPPKIRLSISLILTCFVLYLSMLPMMFSQILIAPFDMPSINLFSQLCASLIVMHMGRNFYIKGFKGLFSKTPTMDTLIAISTSAALIYSLYSMWGYFIAGIPTHHFYFESICVILCFVLLGKTIEHKAKNNANEAIKALLARNEKQALIIDSDNNQKSIPIDQIQVDDCIKILPHSYIPVDGVLISGEGGVDESMLSGEVLHVFKKPNDKVFAGSLNTSQSFIIKATTTSAHSTLSAIIALIQEATNSKTQISRLADRVSAIFVPSVIGIALIAGIIWGIFKDFTFGFEIFISVLVISCPCALGLATPMAIMLGNTLANKQGIFLKKSSILEITRNVTSIVFDKTGTLTKAELHIQKIQSLSNVSENEILSLCAGIEQGSEHLIAKAILKQAKDSHIEPKVCQNFKSLVGYGIQATYNGEDYVVGSKELFSQNLEVLQNNQALLHIYVAKKRGDLYEILGVIFLEDSIKDSAFSLIPKLKNNLITPYILSGDNQFNTARIAQALGIEQFRANAKPKDKFHFIQDLKAKGNVVMMVGDGINDVGALEASDVSLSFSNASDVSEKTADIVIFNHDLNRIDYILRLSKAVVKNIKENLFWAFCYNIICIPLACGALYGFGILLNPMVAAFAMSLSSVSVVLNAQRLRKFK